MKIYGTNKELLLFSFGIVVLIIFAVIGVVELVKEEPKSSEVEIQCAYLFGKMDVIESIVGLNATGINELENAINSYCQELPNFAKVSGK